MSGYTLKPKQLAQLDEPTAVSHLPAKFSSSIHSSDYHKTRDFHDAVGLPVRTDWSYIPPVSERLLRGKLLIEEVLETLEAMGLELAVHDGVDFVHGMDLEIRHVEGSVYDPIETADGLADIKVIVNGTALCFGIPQLTIDTEVWASNMTKLDENGNPIVNDCINWASTHDCKRGPESCVLRDPTQPVGKVLKPKTYVKANIARLYVEYTSGE